MRIQWAIFGPKVSIWHHRRQNVFYAFWDRANLDCFNYNVPNLPSEAMFFMCPMCIQIISRKIQNFAKFNICNLQPMNRFEGNIGFVHIFFLTKLDKFLFTKNFHHKQF